MDSNQFNPIELGKLISSLDALSRDVIKLETKIDMYLKEAVTRREFDEQKDVIARHGARITKLEETTNTNAWLPKLAWSIITASVAVLVTLLIK